MSAQSAARRLARESVALAKAQDAIRQAERDAALEAQHTIDETIVTSPNAPIVLDTESNASGLATEPISTPSIDAAIAALVASIDAMHPEAKAAAIRAGILAAPAKPKTIRHEAAPRTPREPKAKVSNLCACGCGTTTQAAFAPGHDARVKGLLIRAASGRLMAAEMGWKPTIETREYASTRPMWIELLAAFDTPKTPATTQTSAE